MDTGERWHNVKITAIFKSGGDNYKQRVPVYMAPKRQACFQMIATGVPTMRKNLLKKTTFLNRNQPEETFFYYYTVSISKNDKKIRP